MKKEILFLFLSPQSHGIKERRRGGERLTYEKAVVCNPKGGDKKVYQNRNNVRNIKGFLTNEIRGIHPLLITAINGKQVSL
ncbi:hypothetical protein [Pedobacter sp. NJ-S-72]